MLVDVLVLLVDILVLGLETVPDIAASSKVFTMFEKPRRQLEEHESCM